MRPRLPSSAVFSFQLQSSFIFLLLVAVTLSALPFSSAHAQDSAIGLLKQMIAIAADNGGVGRTQELNALKQRIAALPKPAHGDTKKAQDANAKGLQALKAGQPELAKQQFQSAYQLDLANAEYSGNLGFTYLKTGDLKAALKAFSTALSLAPGRASSWANLAEVYALQDQQREAVACYALTFQFSQNQNKTREFLQKQVTSADDPKIQQAARQASQLSLIQGSGGTVAAAPTEDSLDTPLPPIAPVSRLSAPPPPIATPAIPLPPVAAPPVAPAMTGPVAVPPVATPAIPLAVAAPPIAVLPPPVIAQPASPMPPPAPDVDVPPTNTEADICKEVVRGWLGVKVQEITPELAQFFGFNKPSGGLILNVVPNSPAQVAGLKVDDVILAFNNQSIAKSSDLLPLVDATRPGTSVPVAVFRKGHQETITVSVGESPYPLQQRQALGYPTNSDIEDDLEACECARRGPFVYRRSHPSRANPKLAACEHAWRARQQVEEIAARQAKEAQRETEQQEIKSDEYFHNDQRKAHPPGTFKGDGRGFLSTPELKTQTRIPEEAKEALEKKGIDYTTDFFMKSADNGDIEAVKLFIASGIDVNIKDKDGRTALMYASSRITSGQTATVNALLAKGADVNAKDKNGITALIGAAFSGNGNSAVIRILLKVEGINVDIQEDKDVGLTALMLASSLGDTDIVQALLEKGADVNLKDKAGRTALMHASVSGQKAIVQALLTRGANINIKDNDGRTAMRFAFGKGHTDIGRYLLDKYIDENMESLCTIKVGQVTDPLKGIDWYLDPTCINVCPNLMIKLYEELGVTLNLNEQSESSVLLTWPDKDIALLFFRDEDSCKIAAKVHR